MKQKKTNLPAKIKPLPKESLTTLSELGSFIAKMANKIDEIIEYLNKQ